MKAKRTVGKALRKGTKRETLRRIAERTGVKPDQVDKVLNAFFLEVQSQAKEGRKLIAPGFGTFKVKEPAKKSLIRRKAEIPMESGRRLVSPAARAAPKHATKSKPKRRAKPRAKPKSRK